MDYVFALDVSAEAISSGFTRKVCDSLARMLYGGISEEGLQVEPCFPQGSRICILSYDRTLHFYDFSVRWYTFIAIITSFTNICPLNMVCSHI